MQTACLALLGSRTGEARASVGTRPEQPAYQGMTRLDRCAGQDAEAGRPANRNAGQELQRDSSAGYGSFAVAAKPCWQHSYYPNDVRIPWDRFA